MRIVVLVSIADYRFPSGVGLVFQSPVFLPSPLRSIFSSLKHFKVPGKHDQVEDPPDEN